MIHLTFPDNSVREFRAGVTGREVAEGISKSLAKKAVAMALDGKLADLADPITKDAKIEIVTRDDPRALGLIRHDAAHVMAEAVQELYPGTQVTIGPVIDNGFYYDFFRNQPFTTDDLPEDRSEDARDREAERALHQGGLAARQGAPGLPRQGRDVQGRAGRRHPRGPGRSRSTGRASGSTFAAART